MARLLSLCALLALSAVIVTSELSPLDDRPSDAVVEAQGEGIRRFLQKRRVDTASPVEGEKASNDHATETAAAGTEDANKYVVHAQASRQRVRFRPLIRAKRYGYGYGYGYGGYYGGYGGYGRSLLVFPKLEKHHHTAR